MAKDTDFNDLAARGGLSVVKKQVEPAIPTDIEQRYGRYILKADGVYKEVETKAGDIEINKVCSLLAPFGIARNEKGRGFALILEQTNVDGKKGIWILPLERIQRSGGEEARAEFADLGGRFEPEIREKTEFDNLTKSFMLHPRRLPRFILASRPGWLIKDGHHAYVLTDRTIGKIGKEDVLLPEPGDGAPDHSRKGSLEDWQQHIGRYCCGNSRLVFASALALAGALLALTGGEGGGFHIVGGSSSGKTTTLHIGASIAGPPSGQIKSCDNTANAFESTAVQCSDAVLFLDELGVALESVLLMLFYMLSSGIGRGRADQHGNAKARKQWRILFLTTGETDLASKLAPTGKRSYTGQELRLADIEADAGQGMGIFEELHGFNSPADLADYLKDAASKYHGQVLHHWLTRLVVEVNDPDRKGELLQWIAAQQELFLSSVVPPAASGQVHRVAKRFALVSAAGELATSWGLTGWPQGEVFACVQCCFNAWLSRRGTAGQGEVEQLINQVRGFFERHGESRFTLWGSKSKQPTPNRAGFRRAVSQGLDKENDVYEYFVLPETYKTELCQGFDPRWATKVLVESGLIRPGKDGKSAAACRLPGMSTTRCYHFPMQGEDFEI